MKLNIKKRNIIFYIFLGFVILLLAEIIFDRENSIKNFENGYNSTQDIEQNK